MTAAPTTDAPKIEMSHIGLFVRDIAGMTEFYTRVLGFKITDGGALRGTDLVFLSRDPKDHHQIVLVSGRPPDGGTSVNQISFRVGSLAELRAFHDRLTAQGVGSLDPVDHGNAWSIYFRDPEDNRLEIFMDTPYYVRQPQREALDLAKSDQDIHAATEARFGGDESFKSFDQWRSEIAPTLN